MKKKEELVKLNRGLRTVWNKLKLKNSMEALRYNVKLKDSMKAILMKS